MTNRFLGFSKDSRLITVYKNEDYMYQFNNAVVGIQLSRSAKGNLNQLVGVVRYPPQDIWNKTTKRGWKYYELRSNDLFYFKEVEVWSSDKYNASIENWDANTTAFPQTKYLFTIKDLLLLQFQLLSITQVDIFLHLRSIGKSYVWTTTIWRRISK